MTGVINRVKTKRPGDFTLSSLTSLQDEITGHGSLRKIQRHLIRGWRPQTFCHLITQTTQRHSETFFLKMTFRNVHRNLTRQQSVEVSSKVRNKGHFSYYRLNSATQQENYRKRCDDITLLSIRDYQKPK